MADSEAKGMSIFMHTLRRSGLSLIPLVGVVFFSLALWVIYGTLRQYRYRDVVDALTQIPAQHIILSMLLTVVGYMVLTGYDALGFHFVGRRFSYRKIALASYLGYAFGNNIGNTLITGAGVRYWIYSSFGLSVGEITKIVLFCSIGFWVGFLFLCSVIFLLSPVEIPGALHLPIDSTQPLGAVFLALLVAYFGLLLSGRIPASLRHHQFSLPSIQLTLGQIAVASLDLLLMSASLYVLLPYWIDLSYVDFLAIFLLALAAGIASQVPAGLGVFEGVLLLLLTPHIPVPNAAAVLIVFRGIYYLMPLILAVLIIGIREGLHHVVFFSRLTKRLGMWVRELVPQILAVTTFVAGVMLLLSGATPAMHSRLEWVGHLLPLPVIEMSHFLGSLAGTCLLILASGLQRRLDAAHVMTVIFLVAGAVFSLAKGFDYEEASILAIMAISLIPCRRYFYRTSSLLGDRFTSGWIVTISIAVAGSVWLGAFSYRHYEYSGELWWHFALNAEAPRSMRAMVGTVTLLVIAAIARLLRPVPSIQLIPQQADIDKTRPIIERSRNTYAHLVLRGDKSVLFSTSGNAFIMYGQSGKSWIAMGDPVGPRKEAVELAWNFRDLTDRYGGRTVFFEVGIDYLDIYLDLDLRLHKLGEEARVQLKKFTIDDSRHRGLRQACNHLTNRGYRFEIISREHVPELLTELQEVSDAWLNEKTTREKGFSNASFDVRYLVQFPLVVILSPQRIVAFANLLLTTNHEELSVDLMRHLPDAPNGTMDFLFTELLLWGREHGYDWFNFGMAPLSGLVAREGAPLWDRVGSLIYRHGEHFYNFKGLRQYKEKFQPEWKPRYLACSGGIAFPIVLMDVASLIAGGVKGIVSK